MAGDAREDIIQAVDPFNTEFLAIREQPNE